MSLFFKLFFLKKKPMRDIKMYKIHKTKPVYKIILTKHYNNENVKKNNHGRNSIETKLYKSFVLHTQNHRRI